MASNKISSLGIECFSNCKTLKIIEIFESNVTIVPANCFYGCKQLTIIDIPYQLKVLDSKCFFECSKLSTVTFPSTLTTISEYAFQSCSIQEVNLYNCIVLETIGDYAFSNNLILTKLILSPNLENINVESFSYTSIRNFTVPSSLKTIGNDAFKSCARLSSFVIPADSILETIGIGAFRDCIEIASIECKSPRFSLVTGALFDSEETSLILFPPASPVKYFALPSKTRNINEGAFMGCKNLIFVFIPSNSVKRISSNAFEGCTCLKMINIPLSVSYIGENVFYGCTSLKCGIEVENKTKSFRETLVNIAKLDVKSMRECLGLITQNCRFVFKYNIFLLTPIIIM